MGFDVPLQQDLLKNTINIQQNEQENGLLNQDMSMQGQQNEQENGLLNQDISMQGQQKNISSFEQFNNNMSMQRQQPEQENLNRQTEAKQQKDGWMTVEMKETEEEMQKDYDKAHVTDSKSLEKAADVRFQNSIDSRKGSCETRTAHKKRMAAGKKLKHRAGLTEHSLKLSEGLQSHVQSKDERLANRQAEGEKYYDNWANNTIEGKYALLHKAAYTGGLFNDREEPITAEEQRQAQAPEMKVLCFLPNDEARAQLLSNSQQARCIAYEKLVNRAMDFDLQPNALCTLAAMQNAVKVQEHSEIVDAVHEYINAEKFAEKQIPTYMMDKFNKFEQVFNTLRSGTEATVKLQGINLDGSNVYDFDKDMTAGEKKTLEATRKATQKDKSHAMSSYEKSLAEYNKEFTGKGLEAKQEAEAAYITKGKLSHKDYQRMRAQKAVLVKGDVSMYTGTYLNDEWSQTDYGKQAGDERLAVEQKMNKGIALSDKEKETIGDLKDQLASILPYIEISDADNLFGNDAKLRAAAQEKVLDKMLAMPITINKDINYYFNEASPEETAAISHFSGQASAMSRALQNDKIAVQNIPAEKREKFSALCDAVSELYKILDAEAPLRGYSMEGEQYECTEAQKQELAAIKAQHMEPYQNAAAEYSEQYNDSDELSQQKIAVAKSEMGTDLGITKHTLDMADALRRQQPPKARFGVRRTQAKKEDFLPEYSSARTKANKMADLMESVMGFKLDIKNASAAPDMKNIPEIIAHGKKVEEAKQHIKEAQELKVVISKSAMAQWVSYSAAFDALYSAAEAVVGMQGLTIEGESRYAQNPEITADDVKAERYQLGNERELAGERAKQLITDYNKQHIESTYEGSLEIAKAAKLLGTTIGVTAETYGLATTLRANAALSKSNAEEGKKLRESDALKPMMAKQDALAAKKEAFENEYQVLHKLHYAAIDSGDAEMRQHYYDEKEKHGKHYEYTEAEQQILPRELNKYSDELLHLVQGDDKVKLFSESPEERASVYVKLIDTMLSKEVPENLYDPSLVQKLPEIAQFNKEFSALRTLCDNDSAVRKFIPSGLSMRLSDLRSAISPTTDYQKAMMQEHGIDTKGESLHTGAEAEKENYFMFENARQLALTEDKNYQLDENIKGKPREYKVIQAAAKAKWHEQGGGDNEFTERFAAEQKKRAQGAQNAK